MYQNYRRIFTLNQTSSQKCVRVAYYDVYFSSEICWQNSSCIFSWLSPGQGRARTFTLVHVCGIFHYSIVLYYWCSIMLGLHHLSLHLVKCWCFHFLYSDGPVARPGDGPGGVWKAKSAKNGRNHPGLPRMMMTTNEVRVIHSCEQLFITNVRFSW